MTKRKLRRVRSLKMTLFFSVMIVMMIIGLLWFLRPKTSDLEKRKLTEFPKFEIAKFMDGSWFSQVDTWYADTYPLREIMVAGNGWFKGLYGPGSSRIIGGDDIAESIPSDEPDGPIATLPDETEAPSETEPPETGEQPSTQAETKEAETGEGETKDGNVGHPGDTINDVYVVGDTGYGLYYFKQKNAEKYAAILNRAADKVDGTAQVYSVIGPINSGVLMSDELQKQLKVSDQGDAIDWIFGRMSDKIRKVSVYGALRQHVDEYIYFRTDHHWTQRGAYYAYREWCKAKGVTPHELSEFKTASYDNFLGYYYSKTQLEVMKKHPDTVETYIPMGTNKMVYRTRKNEDINWQIIHDVSGYKSGSKYSCFSGSDNPLSWAENPNITDGSACLVVKDSFGNSFIPFLIDHYQKVYWIDFRLYKGSYAGFVKEKGIQDVIFINNIYNTSSAGNLDSMLEFVSR